MKLKVTLADKDDRYVDKFAQCVQNEYLDKIELSIFSSQEQVQRHLKEEDCDVFLHTSDFEAESRAAVSILLRKDKGTGVEKGEKYICKYDKIEHIYQTIKMEFADTRQNTDLVSMKKEGEARIIVFLSGCGGAGKSVCAASFAKLQALSGKRVFYLSMEQLSASSSFFQSEKEITMSQVLFWIKRVKGDLVLKLEGALQQDNSGVYFWNSCTNPSEIEEMSSSDWKALLLLLLKMDRFDYIVVDTEQPLGRNMVDILGLSDSLIWIMKNNLLDMEKATQLKKVYVNLEEKLKQPILSKSLILINQCVQGQYIPEQVLEIPVIGTVMQFPLGVSAAQMVKDIIEQRLGEGIFRIA